jgi:hypothetical protein
MVTSLLTLIECPIATFQLWQLHKYVEVKSPGYSGALELHPALRDFK